MPSPDLPPPFWMVWCEDGHPPKFMHKNETSAEMEAERLAKLKPGQKFWVLAPASCFVERRVSVERFDLTDRDVPF